MVRDEAWIADGGRQGRGKKMVVFFVIITVIFFIVFAIRFFFKSEIAAIFERDPAARNILEVILLYSGLHAIILYRISRLLYIARIPILPRFLSQLGRFFTGIEIHPGARIGNGLFIDHGMGVVIGETSVVGDNVTLFQGVTLGGTGKEKGKRHPTLGNDVVVGAGAKVLGNINVGDNVAIGANAVVIKDVSSNSTVVGVPGRIVKQEGRSFPGARLDHTSLPDPLAQAIDKLQDEINHIEGELKKHSNDLKHKIS
ncbi:MAG: serine O-acetyltransferase EpsC [Candidatus Omnitrophota bacterium]